VGIGAEQPATAVVRDVIEAANARDWSTLETLLEADVYVESPLGGRHWMSGRRTVVSTFRRAALSGWLDLEPGKIEALDQRHVLTTGVVLVSETRPRRAPTVQHSLWEVSDGKVSRPWLFSSKREAQEAFGRLRRRPKRARSTRPDRLPSTVSTG